LNGHNSITITNELVYTIGDTMNKLPAYILIFSLILSAQIAILDLQFPILYAYPEGWSDDIQLTPGDPKGRNIPDVDVCDYNNVWAAWDTATWMNGTAEILYSKRDSLGNCLIPETAVSNNPSYSIVARVAVDTSNNVHFVWRDQTPQGMGLWHAKLGNDGTVLVPPHLAVTGGGGIGVSTEITLNKFNNINVAWEEAPSGYSQMSHSQLDSLGDPIIEKIRVSPEGLNAYWVGIGTDSFANSHLACRTDTPGTSDRLTYSKLDKDGHILISNKVLATGGNNSIVSDLNQKIHIVYTNPAGPGNRIDYLKLDQDGNILIGPQTISIPQIASNTYPHVALDSLQYLHVVWQGDSSAVCHIMYCKMDTLGNYVIPAKKIVYPPHTNGAGEPRIVVDRSNRLHVVWVDGRLGSTNIFYKRGENETGIEEARQSREAIISEISMFPNPFTDKVNIKFRVGHSTRHRTQDLLLRVYDVSGRLVREIAHTATQQAYQIVTWSGEDNCGSELPDGVYFLSFIAGDYTETRKLLLIR
jgi:hypothetical protein